MMGAVNLAEGMLALLAAEPGLLPEGPAFVTVRSIERRAREEAHACLRCGRPAHLAYAAATKAGNRWLDLCRACDHWLRELLDEAAHR